MFGKLLWKLRRCIFGQKHVACNWDGRQYSIPVGYGETEQDAENRFLNYAPKAPICIGCKRLIFPGMPVSLVTPGTVFSSALQEPVEITETGIAHCSHDCSPSTDFCGWVTNEGTVISPFGEDRSAAGRAIRAGKPVIARNISSPSSFTTE